MNPQDVITELEKRYNRILSLDSDKAFFFEIAVYTDYGIYILRNFPSIHGFLLKKVEESTKEIEDMDFSPPNKETLEKLSENNTNKLSNEETEIITKKYLQSISLDFHRDTDLGFSWHGLLALWKVVLKKQLMIDELKDDDIFATEKMMVFTEFKNIANQTNQASNKILTRENYLNYLTQVHEFLRNELRGIAKNTLVSFPHDSTVIYDDKKHIVFFKLGDGMTRPEVIDFSKAPTEWMLFECFWELKKKTLKDTFTIADIIGEYKTRFGKDITQFNISHRISNINKKINAKDLLGNRFKFISDQGKSWQIVLI